ncbi:MAG: hypothetical protein GWO81_07035 [Verrucomicrobia bacterium]|nr:hypothetical protein [Verrucomicrobiota bacterium]
MNISKTLISLFLSLACWVTAHADLAYSTNFSGSEGYVNGAIDKKNQQANPTFSETAAAQGGLYFPKSQGPDYGVLRRNPTSKGARAILQKGAGAGFKPGSTWSTRIEYSFEGLPAMVMGGKMPTMLGGLGFTNSKSEVSELIYVGIQKAPQQSESYQFYVFGQGGGGFFSKNVDYLAIGDDASDADDLTDKLAIEFTVTKSSKAGVLSFVATLSNVDKGTTVVTLSGDLNVPKLYNKDLHAYVSSGSISEGGNYDLFNLHALSSKAETK